MEISTLLDKIGKITAATEEALISLKKLETLSPQAQKLIQSGFPQLIVGAAQELMLEEVKSFLKEERSPIIS